jgi:hypothetical protein
MINITEKIKTILEKEGWIIECESPLEISHKESKSFSTGMAAELVIESIMKDKKENGKDFLLQIMNENKSDGYEIAYGRINGRIETYSMDKDSLYGYDSGGGYTTIPLEEVDMDLIREVQLCKIIYKA